MRLVKTSVGVACRLHVFAGVIPVPCGQTVGIPVQCGQRASIPVQCEQMVTDDVAQLAQINRAKGFWVLGLGL